ncbi:TIGR03084 family metal-binding protein [Pseudonocardia sp. DR1-2]|uniref:TIGR03084 family metal-binding protein n=1 Tax=Pseudonocardia sp. DR1-2 TaxID=2951168 RepID=UPI002042E4F5|nr:TIGR03084 family metal-binding protein [Pseudonocardia sp. DR1-2]MCM3849492.1 TIGR03084 family metal-binding protein [Pseudonocardia sp. DR1-2]
MAALLTDLDAEREAVADLVRKAGEPGWRIPTPAAGWDVRDQIAHLTVSDECALLALTDPRGFARLRESAALDPAGFERRGLDGARAEPAPAVAAWRAVGSRLRTAFLGVPADGRVGWFGPSMSPLSLATARLMETWAHGWDIGTATGLGCAPTDRLRHVAGLGVRARAYGYVIRDRPVPSAPVRVRLRLPSGRPWVSGPPEAADEIAGPAEDFCLVLARRRRWEDTGLTVTGSDATEWMRIGQMFAGPPGPPPGTTGSP